ncbi:MAG: hypothetical protein EP338_11180 [Bacteroidetes bacterium]|nr:MAG: hypothetical protein EP338_11180 [Bacteroidota bacterium]
MEKMMDTHRTYKSHLHFEGLINHQNKVQIIQSIEETLQNRNVSTNLRKQIVHATIELLQNIQDYKDQLNHEENSHSFAFQEKDDSFQLIASNNILTQDFRKFYNKLNNIENQSLEEISETIRENLTKKLRKKGLNAGNGMLRLYNLSQKNIQIDMQKISKNLIYFTISISFEKP